MDGFVSGRALLGSVFALAALVSGCGASATESREDRDADDAPSPSDGAAGNGNTPDAPPSGGEGTTATFEDEVLRERCPPPEFEGVSDLGPNVPLSEDLVDTLELEGDLDGTRNLVQHGDEWTALTSAGFVSFSLAEGRPSVVHRVMVDGDATSVRWIGDELVVTATQPGRLLLYTPEGTLREQYPLGQRVHGAFWRGDHLLVVRSNACETNPLRGGGDTTWTFETYTYESGALAERSSLEAPGTCNSVRLMRTPQGVRYSQGDVRVAEEGALSFQPRAEPWSNCTANWCGADLALARDPSDPSLLGIYDLDGERVGSVSTSQPVREIASGLNRLLVLTSADTGSDRLTLYDLTTTGSPIEVGTVNVPRLEEPKLELADTGIVSIRSWRDDRTLVLRIAESGLAILAEIDTASEARELRMLEGQQLLRFGPNAWTTFDGSTTLASGAWEPNTLALALDGEGAAVRLRRELDDVWFEVLTVDQIASTEWLSRLGPDDGLPAPVNLLNLPRYWLAFRRGTAYLVIRVSDTEAPRLLVFDVSDQAAPALRSELELSTVRPRNSLEPELVEFDGRTFIWVHGDDVENGTTRYNVVDATDTTHPTLVGSVGSGESPGFSARGFQLGGATVTGGGSVIEWIEHAPPNAVQHFELQESFAAIDTETSRLLTRRAAYPDETACEQTATRLRLYSISSSGLSLEDSLLVEDEVPRVAMGTNRGFLHAVRDGEHRLTTLDTEGGLSVVASSGEANLTGLAASGSRVAFTTEERELHVLDGLGDEARAIVRQTGVRECERIEIEERIAYCFVGARGVIAVSD